MFERFSLYKIDNIHQIPFDSKLYSKYKYGDHIQAKKFGDQLAHAFINQFHSFILKGEQQFICISSPFGCVPPAAFFIFKTFCEILNDFLVENGREQIEERKIVRVGTISEDYSLLSRSERLMRINEERYFIDKNGLENKFLLFLDDIRITGMHEKNIIDLLAKTNIRNRRLFIYYAELINENIPPAFEHQLNTCFVKSLDNILDIINEKSFILNTRVIKEILRSDHKQIDHFLSNISDNLLIKILNLSIESHYNLMKEFLPALRQIESYFKNRENNVMN